MRIEMGWGWERGRELGFEHGGEIVLEMEIGAEMKIGWERNWNADWEGQELGWE